MPRTFTHVKTLFTFDELSKEAQEKAIEELWDCNVDHDWWDATYGGAAEIGLEITEFDTDRGTIRGDLTESLLDCCKLIRKNHGKECDTFATAKQYLTEYIKAFKKDGWKEDMDLEDYTPVELLTEFGMYDEAADVENDFKKALLEDYLVILRKEYEYLTSKEAIKETIKANDWYFNAGGKLHGCL